MGADPTSHRGLKKVDDICYFLNFYIIFSVVYDLSLIHIYLHNFFVNIFKQKTELMIAAKTNLKQLNRLIHKVETVSVSTFVTVIQM